MTFEEATAIRDDLDALASRTGKALQSFPKGPMGLTPDAVKASTEYRLAKAAFNTAFQRLQHFNIFLVKTGRRQQMDNEDNFGTRMPNEYAPRPSLEEEFAEIRERATEARSKGTEMNAAFTGKNLDAYRRLRSGVAKLDHIQPMGSYATDSKCHNANRGTFNHECHKPATWLGMTKTGFVSGYCDSCKASGDESKLVVAWTRAD